MKKCPHCGTTMVKFSEVRFELIPKSKKVKKFLVTGEKCLQCNRRQSVEETPLQKEKPKEEPTESRKIFVQPPQEILSL